MTVHDLRRTLQTELLRVFHGSEAVLDHLLILLIVKGHGLVEDVPGTGKTTLVKAFAKLTGLRARRIQGTPDLAPGDILGWAQYDPSSGRVEFKDGPIVTNILLVDEINRAPPRTQSALLQAMAENAYMRLGEVAPLPDPFLVLATQNPIEFEGTFPLPEAQRDRFLLQFTLGYPRREQEILVMTQPEADALVEGLRPVITENHLRALRAQVEKIHCDDKILHWIRDLAEASRQDGNLALGISPRGTRMLYQAARARALLHGRSYVVPEDVTELLVPVCQGRIVLKPSALARGLTPKAVLEALVGQVATPALRGETS